MPYSEAFAEDSNSLMGQHQATRQPPGLVIRPPNWHESNLAIESACFFGSLARAIAKYREIGGGAYLAKNDVNGRTIITLTAPV